MSWAGASILISLIGLAWFTMPYGLLILLGLAWFWSRG